LNVEKRKSVSASSLHFFPPTSTSTAKTSQPLAPRDIPISQKSIPTLMQSKDAAQCFLDQDFVETKDALDGGDQVIFCFNQH
jgi:hypothetical protein